MKEHIYKNLGKYGFLGAGLFIILAILLFNHYWSALGVNPKTTMLPEITKEYEEFKDYTTLLFYLISAVGSILSSLLIILFYGAWKEQHNKTVISDEAKKVWNLLTDLSIQTIYLDHEYYNLQISEYLYFNENKKIINKIDKIKKNTENTMVRFHYFNELSGSKDASILYMEFYGIYKDYKTYLEKIGDKETISDIEVTETDFRERLCEANQNIRLHLRQFILA